MPVLHQGHEGKQPSTQLSEEWVMQKEIALLSLLLDEVAQHHHLSPLNYVGNELFER